MLFEWDDNKAKENLVKHKVPFDFAIRVFDDECHITWLDTRFDYDEERFVTLGLIDGRLFTVAHTLRGEKIRLISARKATRKENRVYDTDYL